MEDLSNIHPLMEYETLTSYSNPTREVAKNQRTAEIARYKHIYMSKKYLNG